MVLTDWTYKNDWSSVALDSSDSATLMSGQTKPCLAVTKGSSTEYHFWPQFGFVNSATSGNTMGFNEGVIEAKFKGSSTTFAEIGFFIYGTTPETQTSFTGYRLAIVCGSFTSPNYFNLEKVTSGSRSALQATLFSDYSFSDFLDSTKWKRLKLTWWVYGSTSLAFKVEYDQNDGNGYVNVYNTGGGFYYVDTAPLTSTTAMNVGLYLKTATEIKIDDVILSKTSNVIENLFPPSVDITTTYNHTSLPGVLSSGEIEVIGTAADTNGFQTYLGNSDVRFSIDGGAYQHLADPHNLSNLTSINTIDSTGTTINWYFTTSGLSVGNHTVSVKAIDSAGHESYPISRTVTVT